MARRDIASPRGLEALDPRLCVLALIGVAALIYLPGIGQHSLWRDEVYVLDLAHSGWDDLWTAMRIDGWYTPLYLFLMRAIVLVGEQEWLVRLPSVIFAVASVAVVFLLARRVFGQQVALIASALLLADASLAHYAHEVRPYTIQVFLVSLSWLTLLRALEARTGRAWAAFVVVTVLAVYIHLTSIFFVIGQVAYLAFRFGREVIRKNFIGVFAVVGLCLAPFGAFAFSGAKVYQWPPLNAAQVKETAFFLAGAPTIHAVSRRGLLFVSLALWTAGSVSLALMLRRSHRSIEAWRKASAIVWFVVPPATAIVVSLATPVLVYRYLIAALPAGVILSAFALTRLRPAWLRALGVVAVLALTLAQSIPARTGAATQFEVEDWRGAVNSILAEARPQDGIIIAPRWAGGPVAYYTRRAGDSSSAPPVIEPQGGEDSYDGNLLAQRYRRVWFLGLTGARVATATAYAGVERGFAFVETRSFDGVDLVLLEARSVREARPPGN